MFYDPIGPLGCGAFGGGVSADCDPHFVSDARVYHARDGHLIREDAGRVVFDVPLLAPVGTTGIVVSLHIALSELRVAGVVDGDVVVMRRSAEDGSALGDYRVAHSGSPARRVQLGGADAAIDLQVLADRPWRARLDPDDGTLIDRAEVGVSLDELSPDAPGRTWLAARVSAALGDVTARNRHVRSRGAHRWDVLIDDPIRCAAYALLELGGELAVLHHCPASSAAGMTFLDPSDGHVLGTVLAGTIGTIGHSMYHAEVSVAVARDLVWVRGVESGGSYVCVIDPRAHRTEACSIQRR